MRYVFFGGPEFAAIILEKLMSAGKPPALVVCNPDRPIGRKQLLTQPPTKILAEKHNIPVWQPDSLFHLPADRQTSEILGSVDFFVVAAYSKILPKKLIDLPRLGVVGVHPSLLPKYRGATPIQSVILAGETETGTTIFLIDEKVDHGPVLMKSKTQITNDKNYEILLRELAELSGDLLVETLPKFVAGEIKPIPQNEARATYTNKFSTEDAKIDLEKDDPEIILRKVRALNPEPGVWSIINWKRTKILEAEIKDRKIILKKIQIAGKKPILSRIL